MTGGTVLSFLSDSGTFDQLYIGSYSSLADAEAATRDSYQAIALDNLRVQLTPGAVPEPASMAMLAMGGLGALIARRHRKAAKATA